MSTNIEIETKALVQKSDYKKFVNAFEKESEKIYSQTNYYIDDDNFSLGKYGIALRIRAHNNEYNFTLKTPLSEGLLEKHQKINKVAFEKLKTHKEFPDGDIKRFLTMLGFDVDSLKIMAHLTTKRIDIKYKDGLLSIDQNEYNNKIDYEIEFEYNSEVGAIKIMKELFQKLNIPFIENKRSKIMRAFSSIKNK